MIAVKVRVMVSLEGKGGGVGAGPGKVHTQQTFRVWQSSSS